MNFQNNQVSTFTLPTIENIVFEKLHPDYKKVNIYITIIFFFIILLIYLGLGFFIESLHTFPFILIAVVSWSIIAGISFIIVTKSYEYEGYALREKDILYKSGIFFKSLVIIPFNRVQHCEIEQGPIDRMFNLAELSVFTAGGSSSDLSIPGLTQDKANALKSFITNRVIKDEEE